MKRGDLISIRRRRCRFYSNARIESASTLAGRFGQKPRPALSIGSYLSITEHRSGVSLSDECQTHTHKHIAKQTQKTHTHTYWSVCGTLADNTPGCCWLYSVRGSGLLRVCCEFEVWMLCVGVSICVCECVRWAGVSLYSDRRKGRHGERVSPNETAVERRLRDEDAGECVCLVDYDEDEEDATTTCASRFRSWRPNINREPGQQSCDVRVHMCRTFAGESAHISTRI